LDWGWGVAQLGLDWAKAKLSRGTCELFLQNKFRWKERADVEIRKVQRDNIHGVTKGDIR
jgi:hypothetical protein